MTTQGSQRGGIDAVHAARATVQSVAPSFSPRAAVILGSGLGDAAASVEAIGELPYGAIEGMPRPSVPGHQGRLVLGRWRGVNVLVFHGRAHRYEGAGWDQVVYPVRLAVALGARSLVLTNMSGGIAPSLKPGTLARIEAHLDLMGYGRPAGKGGRLPIPVLDASPYSTRLGAILDRSAAEGGIPLPKAVYAGVTGPNYETLAEVRALARMGATLVGMSTIGEAAAARDLGMECCAVSCVANPAAGAGEAGASGVHGGSIEPIRHEDVLASARRAAGHLRRLLDGFFMLLAAGENPTEPLEDA